MRAYAETRFPGANNNFRTARLISNRRINGQLRVPWRWYYDPAIWRNKIYNRQEDERTFRSVAKKVDNLIRVGNPNWNPADNPFAERNV